MFISFGAMKKLILLLSVLFVVSCSSSAEEPAPVIKYTLTTAANPTIGGTISPASGQHSEGATVSITASPAAEYLFSSWTGATGTTATASVVMNSNKTVTANFVKKKYALTISVEGEGTVTEKVINAGAAKDYNSGKVVELLATPSSGWSFVKWDGDLTGSENPIEITIDKVQTLTAVFEQNLLVFLKGKVCYKNIPAGKQYVHFDLSYLNSDEYGLEINKQYEGWKYFYKDNDDIEEKGCYATGEISNSNLGLRLEWYSDTIINNPKQFKLDGIYGQTFIVTKKSNTKIEIQSGSAYQPIEDWDGGPEFELINLEEFNKLDCK